MMKHYCSTLFLTLALFVLLVSCKGNSGEDGRISADYLRQRVEKLMKIAVITEKDRPSVFTESLNGLYAQADNFKFISSASTFMDFQWTGKVLDVCSEDSAKRIISIKDVKLLSDTEGEVLMNYVDPPCYNLYYTLVMKLEGGDWFVEDIVYNSEQGTGAEDTYTEKSQIREFIAEETAYLKELDVVGIEDLTANLENNLPTYGPETIFHNNPGQVALFIQNYRNMQSVLKENPNYRSHYDARFADFIEKVEKGASENNIELDR